MIVISTLHLCVQYYTLVWLVICTVRCARQYKIEKLLFDSLHIAIAIVVIVVVVVVAIIAVIFAVSVCVWLYVYDVSIEIQF